MSLAAMLRTVDPDWPQWKIKDSGLFLRKLKSKKLLLLTCTLLARWRLACIMRVLEELNAQQRSGIKNYKLNTTKTSSLQPKRWTIDGQEREVCDILDTWISTKTTRGIASDGTSLGTFKQLVKWALSLPEPKVSVSV